MKSKRIEPGDSVYPTILTDRLPIAAPRVLYALGDPSILHNPLFGLICSIQCPGSIVIQTFDLIRRMRDGEVVIIGGVPFTDGAGLP